jgi:outer membrane protein assembly factor BamB
MRRPAGLRTSAFWAAAIVMVWAYSGQWRVVRGENLPLDAAHSPLCTLHASLLKIGGLEAAESAVAERAADLLSRIGVDRGICVLLADDPAEMAVALARQSRLTVYVQLPGDESVQRTRARVDAAGMLGTRIYVEKGPWSKIHLADDLADAVVVAPESVAAVRGRQAELTRVLRPLGKGIVGDRAFVKPYPAEADDWTHPYHGPDNNPQSRDRIARAPYLTQFLCEPWYVPFPEVTVTSQGRIFKAFGHVGYKERDWPWVNTLVAINGYNGTMLWKRPLEEGFNIHRNSMIAAPEVLYLADSRSCKLLDPATGEVKDEITAPDGATGPVWKWMALEDGVLYALVGQHEFRDPTLRGTRTAAGWPWRPMTAGYDAPEYPWGFGRTFFAVDPKTKRVLWTHTEREPIDGRAVVMNRGRIYCYSHPNFLACLDANSGRPLWRNSDPKLLEAIGPHDRAQTAPLGFSTSAYMKCSDRAVYFAGPQRRRLVAASTEDGRLLWQYPHGNFQLVLRGEGLYAMGRTGPSKLFDPLSGKVLAEIETLRGNCTRATGTADSIFTRGHQHGGTMRLAVADNRPERIALIRPDCHDGVIVAGGRLYWGPWMCDCSISLVGMICLGPAGDFDFNVEATDAQRLDASGDAAGPPQSLAIQPGDWPAYRADNQRTAASQTDIPARVDLAWQHEPPEGVESSPPVTAGGLAFVGGSDGIVRAFDAEKGKLCWKGYTGGRIFYPPTVDQGRLLVGSDDGCVYAWEAVTGKPLWRFRAAPAERKIHFYGRLASTWPVASGVLVDHGVVYAAAGLASWDGTHVYALDAASGRLRWQNNTSGRMLGDERPTGVSVQGHLLLHQDRLYLAGGNVVSPAVYDVRNGRCLNTLEDEWAKAPRGRELFLLGGKVIAYDRLLYAPKRYWVGRYFARHLVEADSGEALILGTDGRIGRIDRQTAADEKPKALWQSAALEHPVAMALGTDAVVVTGTLPVPEGSPPQCAVAALALADGRTIWSHPLPGMPIDWGLALDAAGRVLVTLEDGPVLCFAPGK